MFGRSTKTDDGLSEADNYNQKLVTINGTKISVIWYQWAQTQNNKSVFNTCTNDLTIPNSYHIHRRILGLEVSHICHVYEDETWFVLAV
jgi:hypothetical protein